MNDTASPSMAKQLGFAAKVMLCLEKAGMTEEDFAVLTNDIKRRNAFVAAWRESAVPEPALIAVPEVPNEDGLRRFLGSIVGWLDHAHATYPAHMQGGIIDLMVEYYVHPGRLAALLSSYAESTPREVTILVLRSGMLYGEESTYGAIGDYLGIGSSRANELHRRAIRKATLLVFASDRGAAIDMAFEFREQYLKNLVDRGDVLIQDAGFSTNALHTLGEHHRFTIGQVAEVRESEMRKWRVTNLNIDDFVAEVKAVLGGHGLSLREEDSTD